MPPVELTAREFDLLAFLMHAPGRVFTREQIYEGVWGFSYLGESKVIDFFVSALRRKLDTSADGSIIRTVRGVGLHDSPVSVRLRLAAWFVLVMAVLVVATSAITYAIVRSDLHDEAQHARATRLARAAARGEPDELRLDGMAAPGDRIWLTAATGVVVNSTTGAPGAHAGRGARDRQPRAVGVDQRASDPQRRGPGDRAALRTAASPRRLDTLLRTLVAVGVGILVAAGLMGAFLARRALRPVDRMRQQVDDIPGDALDRRITEGRPDELGRLAHAFNRLLERAEHAADQQQRFVADASHELKTPLTALQGHARILARSVEREEWALVQESTAAIGHETRRVAATVAELLSLAEAGSPAVRAVPVRLDSVAAEACDEMRALDPERPLEASLAPTTVSGDERRLGELVRVLVDNALKYSPPGSPVTVTVSDVTGPTLTVARPRPRPHRARTGSARSTASTAARPPGGVAGSGLGLAIAQAICERHRAVLTLEPATGGGTLATVRFPPGSTAFGARAGVLSIRVGTVRSSHDEHPRKRPVRPGDPRVPRQRLLRPDDRRRGSLLQHARRVPAEPVPGVDVSRLAARALHRFAGCPPWRRPGELTALWFTRPEAGCTLDSW